jgi:hypothetical protein
MNVALIGFGMAAAIGLTFLAYKRPEVYRTAYPRFLALVFLAFAGVMMWDTSNSLAFGAVVRFIPLDKITEATAVSEALKVPVGLASIIWIVAFTYLIFLAELPRIIRSDKRKR